MKKLFAILLLVSFSVQIWGYHLYYKVQQQQIRNEVRSRLRNQQEEETTIKFVFNLSLNEDKALQWEEDHEFSYNGTMYDVIEKKTIGEKLYIRCISDGTETSLVNSYKGMLKDDFSGNANKRTSPLKKLFSALFEEMTFADPVVFPGNISLSCFSYKSFLLTAPTEVLTPPPQSAS